MPRHIVVVSGVGRLGIPNFFEKIKHLDFTFLTPSQLFFFFFNLTLSYVKSVLVFIIIKTFSFGPL